MQLLDKFNGSKLNSDLSWHHEPSNWELKNNQLQLFSDAKTDFWQKTHYGFQADNGHFLYTEITGDFILETEVICDFKHQYDQAGLMVRVSDQCWVKTSVEFEIDKSNKLGVVVTNNGFSDWSTQDVDDSFTHFKLRITRKNSDYKVEYYNTQAQNWAQLRLFHLFDNPTVQVGVYACSPKQNGFLSKFQYIRIFPNV
ncbi:MAG: DUF1349 domain-containing protein [Flavobacteriaceae bacterium]|nr:DUF1349 domain-containing protein [Flavobacteriaceae bacterium]